MTVPYLHQHYRNSTRILLTDPALQELFLHILTFHGKDITVVSSEESEETPEDFAMFSTRQMEEGALFQPNIVLHSSALSPESTLLLSSIVGGGVLIFPEKDSTVLEHMEGITNFFRKIPYDRPDFEVNGNTLTLHTEIGSVPVPFQDPAVAENLEGLRLLCQQAGLMEEEFYEALMNFNS